jgi:hypothetical protein
LITISVVSPRNILSNLPLLLSTKFLICLTIVALERAQNVHRKYLLFDKCVFVFVFEILKNRARLTTGKV